MKKVVTLCDVCTSEIELIENEDSVPSFNAAIVSFKYLNKQSHTVTLCEDCLNALKNSSNDIRKQINREMEAESDPKNLSLIIRKYLSN